MTEQQMKRLIKSLTKKETKELILFIENDIEEAQRNADLERVANLKYGILPILKLFNKFLF